MTRKRPYSLDRYIRVGRKETYKYTERKEFFPISIYESYEQSQKLFGKRILRLVKKAIDTKNPDLIKFLAINPKIWRLIRKACK